MQARCYTRRMKSISQLTRRSLAVACILLSACATAGPSGAAATPNQATAYGAFLAARYADGQGASDIAADFYMQALRDDPGNQGLLGEGFLAALLSGSPHAQTLAAMLPGNALAIMLEGNQAALGGDFAAAETQYDVLPQDDLAGLIKPLLLAWTQLGQANAPAALNGLAPYFNSGDFGAVYVLNAALIADAAGDNKDAAQLYSAAENDEPNLRLAEILGSWYARQGQLGAADAQLAALMSAHPDLQLALPALQEQLGKPVINTPAQGIAEAYLTLAGALSQPSQGFLRTTFLRFALQMRPDLSAARLLLASTQVDGDDPSAKPTQIQMQNALDTLRPVTKQDALYGPASLQEANLLAALGRPDDAAALLSSLVAATPGDPDLLADTADVLRGASDYDAAIPYYSKSIAAAGTPPPAGAWVLYFDRGICEDQLGQWDMAEKDMLAALNLSPDQPYVLNYLGYSWAVHGEKLGQAKTMLAKAVSLDPSDGAVIDSLGYVNLRLGQTKSALNLLMQAVELDPDDAEVNGHLGDAFWQAGQKLQANYQWQRALSLAPDPKLRAEILAKLAQHFPPPA